MTCAAMCASISASGAVYVSSMMNMARDDLPRLVLEPTGQISPATAREPDDLVHGGEPDLACQLQRRHGRLHGSPDWFAPPLTHARDHESDDSRGQPAPAVFIQGVDRHIPQGLGHPAGITER